MVRGLLTLAFLAGSAAFAENDPATRIAAIETRVGGRIGVAAFDTSNDKRLDYRAEERFPDVQHVQISRSRGGLEASR